MNPHDEKEWEDWRWQLANRVTRPGDLGRWLDGYVCTGEAEAVIARHPMAVTPYYLSLARKPWAADPVVRMAVPDPRELEAGPDRVEDFTGEERESPVPGLIHRYSDRVLLITTRTCPVLCRFCMRRRIFADDAASPDDRLAGWTAYIAGHPGIREVILSGGDPLVLDSGRLETMLESIRAVPHVELIRIGTRAPVSLPMRVDDHLCRLLERFHPLWLVTHFNHPREVNAAAAAAVDRLLRVGIPVLNQSVLLRGINDMPETLERLLRALGRIRVRPLYLHQCDPVSSIGHFRTPLRRGPELLEALRPRLSGTLLPRFMVDLPDGGGKIPLDGPQLRDLHGRPAGYPEDPKE